MSTAKVPDDAPPEVFSPEPFPEAGLYHLDGQVGFILRRAQQRHAALFMALMPHELTPTQFAALVRLGEVERCSQNHLGRLTAMDVATVKGVVDRLRARGLVEATADPGDLRRTALTLTGKGREILQEAQAAGLRITEQTLAPLTGRERATLLRILAKIAE